MQVEVFGNLIQPDKLEVTTVNYSTPSGRGYIVENYDEENNTGLFNPELGRMWTDAELNPPPPPEPQSVEEQLEEIKGVLADMIMLQTEVVGGE